MVRQWEALHAIVALSDKQYAHFGVPLLRPAYEELIWLEYLLAIPEEANQVVLLLAMRTVAKSVTQPSDHLGITVAKNIGWTQQEVAAHKRALTEVNAKLKTIGKRIEWKSGIPPSFFWISNRVGRKNEYGFLYHATLSYVHFSPHELFRRVWGRHGAISVGSSNFAHYWEEFVAYWSINTFVQMLATVDESLFEGDHEVNKTVLQIIQELELVPIITPSELQPWTELPHSNPTIDT